MTVNTTLSLADGVCIVVPDSIDLMTPYVLREQEDWFEDEIRLLRHLLQPGDNVIDIGANYGVYALSMARTVGPGGAVWAFEPASGTADLLAQSIAVNGFAQVTLERSAVSSASGSAQLSLNQDSELNALVRGAAAGESETVRLVTLDECRQRFNWRDIGLIKIDAEGEETNILKGGRVFFAELSPLVQYEVRAGDDMQMELVQAFADMGYQSYRLVPGLELLIPFDQGPEPDEFLLNLFCCKPDRAAALASRGFLLDAVPWSPPGEVDRAGWEKNLATLPYGMQLAKLWQQTPSEDGRDELEQALALYSRSCDSSLPEAERFGALEAAFRQLDALCRRQPVNLRLASLARVARDYGARSVAVNALVQSAKAIFEKGEVGLSEPFLAPGERFDYVSPGPSIGDWVLAGVMEQLELLGSHSSFYTTEAGRPRLELIRDLGYGSAEMDRRLSMLEQRLGPGPI